jgi:hypothetical protein
MTSKPACRIVLAIVAGSLAALSAQIPEPGRRPARAERPQLFFQEKWKQIPGGGENPATQAHVANPNLEFKLYGETASELQVTGIAGDEGNPIHTWSGMCSTPCAFAFRDKSNFADLTGLARIRVNAKMSGFHQVRPIVKLADGSWLVADRAVGTPADWLETEISVSELRWLRLDPDRVVTVGNWVENPDLSRVDEIGFADLLPGSGHGPGGWSDVAQIAVYAKPVKRN